MKIAINARFLLYPHTGIGQYTINLCAQLNKTDKDHQVFFLCPNKIDDVPNLIYLPEPKIKNRSLKKYLWETYNIPKWCQEHKIDLVHHLYPVPLTKNPSYKQVVTIHDTIPWGEKEYRRSFRTRFYYHRVLSKLRYADGIIAVSNSTKQDFIYLTPKIQFEKIHIVYLACDPQFAIEHSDEQIKALLEKYKITKNFFLYVGGFDPRKNVKILVNAFQKGIAPEYNVELVIVGSKSREDGLYSSLDELKKKLKGTTVESLGNIILTGEISNDDLAGLYQSCLAFVSLSRREGFNIPLIEAAASHTAILASNIPTHREVTQENILFCDPENLKDVIEKMKELIDNEKLRKELKEKSIEIAEKYSWENTATETQKVYESVKNLRR